MPYDILTIARLVDDRTFKALCMVENVLLRELVVFIQSPASFKFSTKGSWQSGFPHTG